MPDAKRDGTLRAAVFFLGTASLLLNVAIATIFSSAPCARGTALAARPENNVGERPGRILLLPDREMGSNLIGSTRAQKSISGYVPKCYNESKPIINS